MTTTTTRFFFRCADCLSVWAHDLAVKESRVIGPWAERGAQQWAMKDVLAAGCALGCGGAAESMGALEAWGRIVKLEGGEAECDSSCTHARGPKCDCKCGGSNHGAGVLADIRVTSDSSTPEASYRAAPKSGPAALARATEWRATLAKLAPVEAALVQEAHGLAEKRMRDRWLGEADYSRQRDLGRDLATLRGLGRLRTHPGRMAAAEKLLRLLPVVAP